MNRNLNLTVTIAVMLMLMLSGPVYAIPMLSLDISDAEYDTATETVTATSQSFTLYALLNNSDGSLLNDTYYISAAIAPQISEGADLGYFTFNGQTIHVTEDMVYGVPPVEENLSKDAGDLPTHGIFPTYFVEFEFTFDDEDRVGAYNSQDDPGGFELYPYQEGDPFLYYAAFEVDVAGLSADYVVHFDLYHSVVKDGGDIDQNFFAPFSHDAQSAAPVPEPATLLLLGSGLLGVVGITKRKKNDRV